MYSFTHASNLHVMFHLPCQRLLPCFAPRHISTRLKPIPRPPTSTLFPYTTLFRSRASSAAASSPLPENETCEPIFKQPALLVARSEEHTSELQSREKLVCRLLLEKKKVAQFDIFHHAPNQHPAS